RRAGPDHRLHLWARWPPNGGLVTSARSVRDPFFDQVGGDVGVEGGSDDLAEVLDHGGHLPDDLVGVGCLALVVGLRVVLIFPVHFFLACSLSAGSACPRGTVGMMPRRTRSKPTYAAKTSVSSVRRSAPARREPSALWGESRLLAGPSRYRPVDVAFSR